MTIVAIGSFVPTPRISNVPKLAAFGRDMVFLEKKIGFLTRAQKLPGTLTSDMCVTAFEDLERIASIDRSGIGLLVVVTQNPDRKIPHTSAIVHQKLGLGRDCATIDISLACTGYPHAIAVVEGMMATCDIACAVVLTCDPYLEIIDPDDLATAMIFGDAATATLMLRDGPGYALRDATFGTLPGSNGCLHCEEHLFMDGRQVMANVVHEVPGAIRGLLAKHALTPADVPFFALHQASRHVVELLRADLGLTEPAAPFEAGDIGNTASSSIPLLLQDRVNQRRHERMAMCGFGAGFSWGTVLLERNSEITKT